MLRLKKITFFIMENVTMGVRCV